jgi:hypothetical protein
MYHVIDKFAQHQSCTVGLSEKCVDGRENILCARCPDVKVLADLGKIR